MLEGKKMLTDMELLVLATKSPVAQNVISLSLRCNKHILAVLASSPNLSVEVANKLASHSNVLVSSRALFRCEDQDVLEKGAKKGVMRARWALRNPNMPSKVLVSNIFSKDQEALLSRCINQTTPLDYRKEALKAETIESFVSNKTPMSNGLVRAFELAIANRWLLETPKLWTRNLRRGLAGLYDISKEQYLSLTKGHAVWPAKHLHPASSGVNLDTTPISELIGYANPAVDFYLIDKRAISFEDALKIPVKRSELNAEPHIIGRLVSKFGVGVLSNVNSPGFGFISDTRILASSFTHPGAEYTKRFSYKTWKEAELASEMLGDNPEAWEVLVGMAPKWELGTEKLAEAAIRIART